jgi:hypothetical protein
MAVPAQPHHGQVQSTVIDRAPVETGRDFRFLSIDVGRQEWHAGEVTSQHGGTSSRIVARKPTELVEQKDQ